MQSFWKSQRSFLELKIVSVAKQLLNWEICMGEMKFKRKGILSTKAAGVWIKHQVNSIQSREHSWESVIQGVSQWGSLLWHPVCLMVSKQKRKLKIMGCKTAHSNYLSLLLSKADCYTCGTELIIRYLLWSLSIFSSCSVSHEFFCLSANTLKSIPPVNPLKQDSISFILLGLW